MCENYQLCVDIESVYLAVSSMYGEKARIDYLKLPKFISKQIETTNDETSNPLAFVVFRRGGSELITKALKKFGYQIEFTNQESQEVEIVLLMLREVEREDIDHIVFMTCNRNMLPLIVELAKHKKVSVVTLPHIFPQKRLPRIHQIIIKQKWFR